MGQATSTLDSAHRFPLPVKLIFTAFVAAHVYVNWREYGPLNFLWFCDITVLVVLAALWLENRLLLSIAAVAILLPTGLWIFDLACRIALGHYVLYFAGYMFDPRVPKRVRVISTFHIWLPLLLIWMLMRIGYDRRALVIQWIFSIVLLLTCRLVSVPPSQTTRHHQAVNINWVYGSSDFHPQTAMPGWMYLVIMLVFYPVVIYVPTHLVLCALFSKEGIRRRAIPCH